MTSELTLPQFAVANASAVTPRILVGGDLSWDSDVMLPQVQELLDHGVTHVVDCRLEASDADVWDEVRDVSFLHHGMDDAGQEVPNEWFDTTVSFLREALADPDAIVLTHCHMGINRGPSLGFALMLAEGWDPIDAMDAIRAARPIAYLAYAEQALRWHHTRTSASAEARRDDRSRMEQWRDDDRLDIAHVIRKIRRSKG